MLTTHPHERVELYLYSPSGLSWPVIGGTFTFLDPAGVRSVSLRIIWNFSKGTRLPCVGHQITECKGPVKKGPSSSGPKALGPIYYFILANALFYVCNFITQWPPTCLGYSCGHLQGGKSKYTHVFCRDHSTLTTLKSGRNMSVVSML